MTPVETKDPVIVAGENTLSSAYDPSIAEATWYTRWENAGYFRPQPGTNAKAFCIVIPPPNVTGSLHMGHALGATLEDILVRWRRMHGDATLWLPGTDHAGIATQMMVERDLLTKENQSRHDLGREAFLTRVWAWKEKYGDRIFVQLRELGCSLDWSRARFTMDQGFSRAVTEVFVRLYEEGLIYQSERLVNWCPRCLTALSDLEVEHDDNHQGNLWSFAYPLADGSGEVVVATTRPETMLGDTAVAVHPDDPRYTHLHGQSVRHPLLGYRLPIITDAILVDPSFGTGCVKVTPAHDFNDFATGKRHGLEVVTIFDPAGQIAKTPVGSKAWLERYDSVAWQNFAGLDRFVARKKIKKELLALGLDRGTQTRTMAVALCSRCETILEPRLSLQWYVKTAPLAEPALAAVKTGATKIIPETWTKTYFHWLENIQDWCISRQLWWGHRIPAWSCLQCPNAKPIVARDPPLHCPECHGNKLQQDQDVLDTWFSSALWPMATLGWPEQTPDLQNFYPVSVMETGADILFFWVARMMMMGCKFMSTPPFPYIYLHAMVRDKNGDKMSKTKGNVVDPLDLVRGCQKDQVPEQLRADYPNGFPAYGADALRFYMAASSMASRDVRLALERLDGYRAFVNKIWNAARFVLMHTQKEGVPTILEPLTSSANLPPADQYILSRLARTVVEVNTALTAFRFADAAHAVYHFVWAEFCDWYIELAKLRLNAGESAQVLGALNTLVTVFDQVLRLLHPFIPFVTEEIWQKLPLHRPTASLMLAPFPQNLDHFINPTAECHYTLLQTVITALRAIRAENTIPLSKPISAIVATQNRADHDILTDHAAEIKALARIATLTFADGSFKKSGLAATKTLEGLELIVPLEGLIDVQAEKLRLERTLTKTQAEHAQLAKKLANLDFMARAPKAVVEKDQARIQELTQIETALLNNLNAISRH